MTCNECSQPSNVPVDTTRRYRAMQQYNASTRIPSKFGQAKDAEPTLPDPTIVIAVAESSNNLVNGALVPLTVNPLVRSYANDQDKGKQEGPTSRPSKGSDVVAPSPEVVILKKREKFESGGVQYAITHAFSCWSSELVLKGKCWWSEDKNVVRGKKQIPAGKRTTIWCGKSTRNQPDCRVMLLLMSLSEPIETSVPVPGTPFEIPIQYAASKRGVYIEFVFICRTDDFASQGGIIIDAGKDGKLNVAIFDKQPPDFSPAGDGTLRDENEDEITTTESGLNMLDSWLKNH